MPGAKVKIGKRVSALFGKVFKKELKMGKPVIVDKHDSASALHKGADTLHGNPATAQNSKADSAGIFQKLTQKVSSGGTISYGYDYGVIPFTTNTTMPLGFNKTEGNFKIESLGLPLDVSFYYSDLKAVSGLRNYYRISYDANKYKENAKQKASSQLETEKAKLGTLYKERQDLEKKLYYLKSMPEPSEFEKGNGKYFDYAAMLKGPSLPADTLKKPNLPNPAFRDSLAAAEKKDGSLAGPEKKEADSLLALKEHYQKSYDSIQEKVSQCQRLLDKCEWNILFSQKLIKDLEHSTEQMGKENIPHLGKVQNTLLLVKKLEIGLCYPNNSTFLISGSAIRGLNLEMENANFFFSFSHGTTLNNLLYTNNLVQNSLSGMQNLYNFFDFNNVKDNRRVTAVKFGPGTKEGTHIHIGMLYGFGSTSYLSDLYPSIPLGFQFEKNYVLELDGRLAFTPNTALDLVYGKSTTLQSSAATGDMQKGINGLLDPQRSNAALARFTTLIRRTKTKITLTTRWIDPFFKSYGIGFMRPDNFRYEFKAEQVISPRIKLTGLFRKEQDNLLALYNYTTNLTTIGATISYKLNRYLNLKAGYNPVLQIVATKDQQYSLNNHNNISNFILTFNPHLRKISSSFNALYSYYNLSNTLQHNEFQSVNLNNTTQLRSPLRFNTSVSWFHSSVVDTNGNNTLLITEEIGYTFKKGACFSVGGKAAHNSVLNWQYGYMFRVLLPLVRHFSLETSFEKLVIGDFYNSYNLAQINKFSYYCSVKLNYHW
jgi:hypothetical protein